MLTVSILSVRFGKRISFDDVIGSSTQRNCYGIIGASGAGGATFLKRVAGALDPTWEHVILEPGIRMSVLNKNCYMIIGANGAGKSTFLKILAGDFDPTSGHVILEPGKRMSVLNQNHNMFDEHTLLETVLMGNKVLYAVKKEMDDLYADYSDENADRIGELQIQFDEMNGWNADSDAASLLSNLGISEDLHYTLMADMEPKLKVRVLLAQALFGNPNVLIMDEPTNDLDFETI